MKRMTQNQSGKSIHQKLLSKGYKPVEREFSLDKFFNAVTYQREEIEGQIYSIFDSFVQKYVEANTSDLFRILISFIFSPECRVSIETILSMITEVNHPEGLKEETIFLAMDIPDSKTELEGKNITNQIEYHIIMIVLDYIKEFKGYTVLKNLYNRGAKDFYLREGTYVEEGDEYVAYDLCKYFYSDGLMYARLGDPRVDTSLNQPKMKPGNQSCSLHIEKSKKDILDKAMYNKGCRVSGYQVYCGDLKEFYPLESFHYQAQSLYKEACSLIESDSPKRHTKILIKGPSGTCKSQWARSFAKYYLSPKGYFTIILPPDLIEEEVVPSCLRKMCIIVDEFSAENRVNDINTKHATENLLRIFDDTSFEDINVRNQPRETEDRSVVWILTSNYEIQESYDPAFLRRMDLVTDFTIDINGKESDLSIGY